MQQASSLRDIVNSSWFARLDLLLVFLGGAAWVFFPEYVGVAPLLLLLLPWVLRIAAREFPFQRTRFDWLLLIFIITTWVGYWASYDQSSALNKAWLLTTSVFLYYALSVQSEENLIWITSGLFLIGVGVSIYFLFTHNFVDYPRRVELINKVGVLWMNLRPQMLWSSIHPNYMSGVAAVTGIFGLYSLRKSGQSVLARSGMLAGFFVVLLALVMATSRGIWMGLASAAGVWLLWRLVNLNGINLRLGKEPAFPILVLIYLCVVVTVLYIGPARSPSGVGVSDYGIGSRAELFGQSLYFVEDYLITGAGLATFPGLYSEYILDIPYYYLPNSHNLFLDVFIEQGILGGTVFFLLYLWGIWRVCKMLMQSSSPDMRFFQWLVLYALVTAVVHGMVDDYLYNAKGSVLSLLLIGLSMINTREGYAPKIVFQWKTALIVFIGLAVLANLSFRPLLAIWYADLGAVQLAKVQLRDFPGTGWLGGEGTSSLDQADASLQTALKLDPLNRTANHRLGISSMLRKDFSSAVEYLNVAHNKAPQHRGITKLLGFSYTWLGETNIAVSFLKAIPETKNELDAYYYWWKEQGRDDLSENAFNLHQELDPLIVRP